MAVSGHFRDRLHLLPARTELLPNAVLPVHTCTSRSPGRPMFWFEQRYWLCSAGVVDGVAFRKQERRREVFEKIRVLESLGDHDLIVGGSTAQHFPVLCSTRGLFCWLLDRYYMDASRRADNPSPLSWSRLISQFHAAAHLSATHLNDRPSVTLDGVQLQVGPCGIVSLADLVAVWPELPQEWGALAQLRNLGLPALLASRLVCVGDLHLFLYIRLRKSGALPHGHPLRSLLHALTEILVWLVEVHVHEAIQRTQHASNARDARFTELICHGGRYRQHHTAGPRVMLLRRMLADDACGQVVARTMGFASSAANNARVVRNTTYAAATRRAFAPYNAFAVGWDGSCHGGPEIIVGYCVCVATGVASVLKPEAACQLLTK